MSDTATPLHALLKDGGTLYRTALEPVTLHRAAHDLKLALFDIDCTRARTKSAVLRAIANAVDFPEHFGGNLDALYDCLTDTLLDQKRGMVLALRHLHENDPGLVPHVAGIVQVCEDTVEFARENGKVFTFVLETDEGVLEPTPLPPTSSYDG
ncbi:barstar family protein [Pigmentiphaga litoralis]|uniref:barstar family protein n=1 Tax=Pigmentiphaga litoralis TaxID=516702 RepID=UPI003B43824F